MKIYNFCWMLLFPVLLHAQTQQQDDKYVEILQNRFTKVIGRPVPSFNAYSITNQFYSEDSLKNKVTLINLWFEACAPCIAEMGALNDLYSKYKSNTDFRFLAFTFEKPADVERIIKKYNIEYAQIPISKDSCYVLNFKGGFPIIMISDKNGKVAYFNGGGYTDPENSSAYFLNVVYPELDRLLNKQD
jgi:thiol-disulfide isomerase/thioredoxin